MSEFRDPTGEIEAILREIAADPDAKLLAVPPAAALVGLADDGPASSRSALLTRAERHLLHVHREELGVILRERCVMELFSTSGAELSLHKGVSAGRLLEVPEEARWAKRAERALSLGLGGAEREATAEDVLGRCLTASLGTARAVTRAALASLRVSPRDSARLYVAIDLFRDGRFDASRRAYEAVLARRTTPRIQAYCWEGIAAVHSRAGRQSECLDALMQSCSIEPTPIALLSALRQSILLGDSAGAARLVGRVDDTISPADGLLDWFVQGVKTSVAAGTLPLADGRSELVRRLEGVAGSASLRILNEAL